jgi:hypothetical protein
MVADMVPNTLWEKATRLQSPIKDMEKRGGIAAVAGVSDQKMPITTNN